MSPLDAIAPKNRLHTLRFKVTLYGRVNAVPEAMAVSDLQRALADLETIRRQVARQTRFLGLGSTAIAGTAAIALVTGFAQDFWLDGRQDPPAFFIVWIGVAVLCVSVLGLEIYQRSRRHHRGLSDAMVLQAAEAFLPVGGAGACLALVIARFAPDQVWMLPGLWQIFVGLGLFASMRILPWQASLVGGGYVLTGLCVIALSSQQHLLSPALMSIPFAVGQGALAVIMHRYAGDPDA
jgi:hypothetical protein